MTPPDEDVLAALPAGVVVVGQNGGVCRLNAMGQRMLGVEPGVVGQPISVVSASLAALIRGQGKGVDGPVVHIRPDGRSVKLDCAASPCGTDGHVVLFRDVSSSIDLQPARESDLRVETISEVLPSLLHDLRNPLAAMTSAVELLVEETRPGDLRSELESILTEGRRMDLGFQGFGMVGRSVRSPRRQCVTAAVHEVVHIMRASAARAGVMLLLDCAPMPDLPLSAAVVRAMLYNMINNAITACREGDEIRVRAGLFDDGSVFSMAVHDTGVGMSEAVLARCTELFFTTRTHGSGLGLSMCRWAVEEAGGLCTVLSTAGRGTRVVVEVPASAAHAQWVRDDD